MRFLDTPINHAIASVKSDLWHNCGFECGQWCSFVESTTRPILEVVANSILQDAHEYDRPN